MTNNSTQLLYTIAGRVAAVAAVCVVILSILMIANYLQTQSIDPLNSKAVAALMEQHQENARDTELKEQVRALDLLARKAYFTHLWQVRTGRVLLFCFAAILVIALKYRSSLVRRLPDLNESGDPEQAWKHRFMARKQVVIGGAALFVLAAVLGILSEKEMTAPSMAVAGGEGSGKGASAAGVTAETVLPEFETMRKQWPSFRGPEGRSVAYSTDVVTSWNVESGENIIWKSAVPMSGFSSPVIWDKKIFLSGADRETRQVYCYDADSGELLWTGDASDVPGSPEDMPAPTGDTGYAASTMAADSHYVFAIFATGDLGCWTHSGERVWATHVGTPENHYGYSSSLICYEKLLFVQFDQSSGGRLIALDKATGDPVYDMSREVGISWASPILINTGTRAELILNSNPAVIAYDPLTGDQLWRVDCMSGEVAPSPAYDNGMVFAVNDYAVLAGIKIGDPAELVWETPDDLSEVSSPAASNGILILPTSWGTISCFNAETGERYWFHDFDDGFYSSPVFVGDRVYIADMPGVVHIFKAAEEFELINSCEMGERVVATPAFMYGRIYIRGVNSLFCIGKE